MSFVANIRRTCRGFSLNKETKTFTQHSDIFKPFKTGLSPRWLACCFPIITRPFIHSTLPKAGQRNQWNQQHQPVFSPVLIPQGARCYFSLLHSSRNRKLCIQASAAAAESVPAADKQATFDSSLGPVWLANLDRKRQSAGGTYAGHCGWKTYIMAWKQGRLCWK